jgi:alginate O-acetyltransferase complex protein AlgI
LLIVISSYIFYGWWDYRFLSLIIISTLVDFLVGKGLSRESRPSYRKLLLWTSIIANIGLLGFFKYYNFFIHNFTEAFTFFGIGIKANTLNIILPVGISFYTFQTLSYTIDVYKRKLEHTNDIISFAAFVSFFPQLVAGPIERATHLLPQFYVKRKFEYNRATDGLNQILWGLFKKIVIADNSAKYADLIFNNSHSYSGSTLVVGALFFTFQIYCDFSAYSDIAIGTARIFGFNIKRNFATPYFSRDIAEFWRRWHISLTTWFRDYIYIPLGGSRGGSMLKVRNIFIIFIVSGFWHGPNWTFIVWGALNAVYFLPLMLLHRNRQHLDIVAKGKFVPTPQEIYGMAATFSLTVFAWIFFRADSVQHALEYVSEILSISIFEIPDFTGIRGALVTVVLICLLIAVEWLGREQQYATEHLRLIKHRALRWGAAYALVFAIIIFGDFGGNPFIYFQF